MKKFSTAKKITSDTNAVAAITAQSSPFSKAQQALKNLINSEKASALEQWKAAGNPVRTPAEIERIVGVKADPGWTQEQMAYLLRIGPFIKPLISLRQRAIAIEANYVVPGRKAIKALMADLYGAYLEIEDSDAVNEVYAEIRRYAKNAHRDTPNATVLVKVVFPDFDSKQAHIYSRSLDYAKSQGVKAVDYANFVTAEGGFEKIRLKSVKSTPAHIAHINDEMLAQTLVRELFAFENEHAFLTVASLSLAQQQRLRSNDFSRVLLIAQLEGDLLRIYARVPLTQKMNESVDRAYFEDCGGDIEQLKTLLKMRKAYADEQKKQWGDNWLNNGVRLTQESLAIERQNNKT